MTGSNELHSLLKIVNFHRVSLLLTSKKDQTPLSTYNKMAEPPEKLELISKINETWGPAFSRVVSSLSIHPVKGVVLMAHGSFVQMRPQRQREFATSSLRCQTYHSSSA
jgi:hypothetical protein